MISVTQAHFPSAPQRSFRTMIPQWNTCAKCSVFRMYLKVEAALLSVSMYDRIPTKNCFPNLSAASMHWLTNLKLDDGTRSKEYVVPSFPRSTTWCQSNINTRTFDLSSTSLKAKVCFSSGPLASEKRYKCWDLGNLGVYLRDTWIEGVPLAFATGLEELLDSPWKSRLLPDAAWLGLTTLDGSTFSGRLGADWFSGRLGVDWDWFEALKVSSKDSRTLVFGWLSLKLSFKIKGNSFERLPLSKQDWMKDTFWGIPLLPPRPKIIKSHRQSEIPEPSGAGMAQAPRAKYGW